MTVDNLLVWFIENKSWILSGVGIALIGGVVRWLFKRKGAVEQKQELTSGNKSVNVQAGRDISGNVDNVQRDKIVIHNQESKTDGGSNAPEDSIPSLVSWLITNTPTLELNRLLHYALRLAQKIEDKAFEKWVRLELNGYNDENGMTEDDIVPKYRTVVGQYSDEYGRPLIISDPELGFVNEIRLRYGVKELEEVSQKKDMIFIRHLDYNHLIKKNLKVEVTRFGFSPVAVAGILNAIRTKLLDQLDKIQREQNHS